jgi:hypothetical protein
MANPDAEWWSLCIDVASRMIIATVGLSWFIVAWFVLGALSSELEFTQQRGPSLSIGEWILLVQMVAGLLLVVLACSPRAVLNITVIRWGFVPVVLLVEVGLAFVAYHWGYDLYRVNAFGMGILLGSASAKMTKLAASAISTIVVGIVLALAATRLLMKPRRNEARRAD